MSAKVFGYRLIFTRKMLALFAMLCTVLIMSLAFVSHATSPSSGVYYRSILIEEGDTINGIAADHITEGFSYKDMIFEIRRLNRLSEDTIYAGSYLVVPVTGKSAL